MSDRQKTRPPTPPGDELDDSADTGNANLDDMRELADRLMARAQDSLRRVGMSDASEFLHATRQSGGQ